MEERVKRWHSNHARVQAYVTTAEFEKLKQLASSLNISISDLVKRAIMDTGRLEKDVYEKGIRMGVDLTVNYVLDKVKKEGPLSIFHIEEFTVPCPKCGGPMLFSSRFKEQWEGKIKPILAKAFSNWAHVDCLKK
jgi:hypothetical protein